MIETLALLLLAHLLADFPLQTDAMIARKKEPGPMALHIGVHFALAFAALGGEVEIALGLAAAHLLIDLIKVHALPDRLWVYLADQLAHVATLVAAVLLFEAETAWVLTPGLFALAVGLSGLIAATWAGGPAVGLLIDPFSKALKPANAGLPAAGRMIGFLERGLIYLLVWVGQPAAVGFLIAAKSILRFDTAKEDQRASEYVIIGTLASFGWALIAAYGALEALALRP